jgi:hypothetical protein
MDENTNWIQDFKILWKWVVAMISRCTSSDSTYSQACGPHSQVLLRLSLVLLYPRRFVASVPRCTRRPLHRCSQLRDLTTLGFWSDNPQIHPNTPKYSHWQKYILLMQLGAMESVLEMHTWEVHMRSTFRKHIWKSLGKRIWNWWEAHSRLMESVTEWKLGEQDMGEGIWETGDGRALNSCIFRLSIRHTVQFRIFVAGWSQLHLEASIWAGWRQSI